MVRLAPPRRRRLARSRRDERNASARQRRRAASREECAFEKAAPFGIEIVEQLLAVELELRAIAIITCTHRIVSRVGCPRFKAGEHRGLRKARSVNRLICSMHHQFTAEHAEILCTTADLGARREWP